MFPMVVGGLWCQGEPAVETGGWAPPPTPPWKVCLAGRTTRHLAPLYELE